MDNLQTEVVTLGGEMDLEQFMAVIRGGATVEFSEEYVKKVNRARDLVEEWTNEERA